MKKVIADNISKQDGVIACEPRERINDRAICYIPKKFFKAEKPNKPVGIGCVYFKGTLKPYNKHSIQQDFAFDYLEITIIS